MFCGFLFLEWGLSGERDDLLLLDKLLEGRGLLVYRVVLMDSLGLIKEGIVQ